MQDEPFIAPSFEISGDQLVIKVPLAQLVAVAEAERYSPVRVTDPVALAKYLIGYLQRPPTYEGDDVAEAIWNSTRHILDDAVFMGAGVRSLLEDIPHLIDAMWQERSKKVLTDFTDMPAAKGKTVQQCVVESIKAARRGNLHAATYWLEIGQDFNEPVVKVLGENGEEAVAYAVTKYGSEVHDDA